MPKDNGRLFDNGYAFSDDFKRNLEDLHKNCVVGTGKRFRVFPGVVIVDGGQGTGKTTAVTNWLDYLNHLSGKGPVSLEPNYHPQIARGQKEFFTNLEECKRQKLPGLLYDEAGDYTRAGHNSRENRKLGEVFDQIRETRVIIFIVLPQQAVLPHSIFFDNKVQFIAHLSRIEDYDELNKLVIYPWGDDSTGPRSGNFLRNKSNTTPSAFVSFVYSNIRPDHHTYVRLGLTEDRANKLDALSSAGKSKLRIEAGLQAQGLISSNDLRQRFGLSVSQLKYMFNKNNIKPTQTVGVKNYYKDTVLELIKKKVRKKD